MDEMIDQAMQALSEKQSSWRPAELTREIAARGGDIRQLNTVRRELSAVKGGGLARACRAGINCGAVFCSR